MTNGPLLWVFIYVEIITACQVLSLNTQPHCVCVCVHHICVCVSLKDPSLGSGESCARGRRGPRCFSSVSLKYEFMVRACEAFSAVDPCKKLLIQKVPGHTCKYSFIKEKEELFFSAFVLINYDLITFFGTRELNN